MQITAAMVKELRARSGAGMMACKKALTETSGDLEAAFEHLRKSGAAKAAKKAGRIAAEGAIVLHRSEAGAVIVEVNSETDFVAEDDNFRRFANAVAVTIMHQRPADLAALAASPLHDSGDSVEAARTELVVKIGENVSIRRFTIWDANDAEIGTYLHGQRIGALVALKSGDAALAKDLAMHIAASNPLCVAPEDIPDEVVAKEREIRRAQAEASGKPADIIEKMISGQMKKFAGEISLLGQPFVKDPDTKVGQLLREAGAEVTRFVRFELGEGMAKKTADFAAEVKAQASERS